MRGESRALRILAKSNILKGLCRLHAAFLDLNRNAPYHAFRGIFKGFNRFLDFRQFYVGTVP